MTVECMGYFQPLILSVGQATEPRIKGERVGLPTFCEFLSMDS